MDDIMDELTLGDFKLFYGIDRELYAILVRDLCRNPSECLQIMALWLWLERGGIFNVISKILSLNRHSINALADEALACIKLLNTGSPFSSEATAIPMTRSLVNTDISMRYFFENRDTVFHEVQGLISDVYIPALSDMMEKARHGDFGESSTQGEMRGNAASGSSALVGDFSGLGIEGDTSSPQGRARLSERSRFARTMFVTFSKGYPVTEGEVRQFFKRMFGDCIESLHMQDVGPNEQALYARVVFVSRTIIRIILNGEAKAKFVINGKHVWMRPFVPRSGRMLPCGCASIGPSVCPEHY